MGCDESSQANGQRVCGWEAQVRPIRPLRCRGRRRALPAASPPVTGGFALHSQLPPMAPYGAAQGQEYSTSGDCNLVCNQGMSMEEGCDVGDSKDV